MVRTLPGSIVECRTGSLPHTTAERILLVTLLAELCAMPIGTFNVIEAITSDPILPLRACHPWVWRTQAWHEDGQLVANADVWAQLLPLIDQHCVTWQVLTRQQRTQLDARLAHRLAFIAAQRDAARTVGGGMAGGKERRGGGPMSTSCTNQGSTPAEQAGAEKRRNG